MHNVTEAVLLILGAWLVCSLIVWEIWFAYDYDRECEDEDESL